MSNKRDWQRWNAVREEPKMHSKLKDNYSAKDVPEQFFRVLGDLASRHLVEQADRKQQRLDDRQDVVRAELWHGPRRENQHGDKRDEQNEIPAPEVASALEVRLGALLSRLQRLASGEEKANAGRDAENQELDHELAERRLRREINDP